jgi:YVTN family beta-propeller protein
MLVASALVVLVYQTSPRSKTCTTCNLGDIDAGWGPVDVAYDNSSGHILVLDYGPSSSPVPWGVTVINGSTDTVQGFLHLSQRPAEMAYDSRNGDLYITSFAFDTIYVLNATTGANVTWISTPEKGLFSGPDAIVYDPVSGYVVALDPPNALVIDPGTNTLVQNVDRGIGSYPVGVNPVTGQVYVTTSVQDQFDFNLTVLNGSSFAVESSLQLNGTPQSIVFDPSSDRVYVAVTLFGFGVGNLYNGSLLALGGSGTHVLASARIGNEPDEIAVDSSNQNLYVTNTYSGNISIINGTTGQPSGSVPVDPSPWSIAYDGRNRCLYTLFYTSSGSNPETDGYLSVIAPPGSDCVAPPSSGLAGWVVPAVLGGLATVLTIALVWTTRRKNTPST